MKTYLGRGLSPFGHAGDGDVAVLDDLHDGAAVDGGVVGGDEDGEGGVPRALVDQLTLVDVVVHQLDVADLQIPIAWKRKLLVRSRFGKSFQEIKRK